MSSNYSYFSLHDWQNVTISDVVVQIPRATASRGTVAGRESKCGWCAVESIPPLNFHKPHPRPAKRAWGCVCEAMSVSLVLLLLLTLLTGLGLSCGGIYTWPVLRNMYVALYQL